MDELDLFRNFRRGVATPSADAQRRAFARLASALEEATGREQAAHLHQGRRRWRAVALAAVVLVAVFLVTPAFTFGIGDRLLSLIQGKPTPARRAGSCLVARRTDDRVRELARRQRRGLRDGRQRQLASEPHAEPGEGCATCLVARRAQHRVCEQSKPVDTLQTGSGPCSDAPDRQSEIYVMNADGSRKRNLTRDRASDDLPTWSPDGRRIAFLRGRGRGRGQLYVVNADGSGLRNLMRIAAAGVVLLVMLVWSPDGRTIYFGRYLISTDGSGARKLPYIPLIAVWSPDGRQIAFVGNRLRNGLPGPGAAGSKDNSEIYVMNADGSGTRRLTHNVGYDGEPAWSPDGRKIAFQSRRRFGASQGRGDLRHERRWKRKAEPHPEPCAGRQSLLVAGRAEDRVCQQPRRATLEAHVMNADGSGQRSLASQEG